MSERNERNDNKNEENKFTGMPNERPYPDFEPNQSPKKQVEQFQDTADNGKMRKGAE